MLPPQPSAGWPQTSQQLILARAVQGVGAAFLIPGSLALISASFAEGKRGRAIGTWSGSTAITTAIGPVLGGWLIQHWSWRWAFFLNLPLAIAVIAISLWRVPESRSREQQRIDGWGALTATLSLAGLVYGFLESASLGWSNPCYRGQPRRRRASAWSRSCSSKPARPGRWCRSPCFAHGRLPALIC